MKPIAQARPGAFSHIEGLIFDLDDTFLDHGKLEPNAYRALTELNAAGFVLVAATGRPAGWGAVLAHQWPVAAVVTENGAIAHMDGPDGVQCIDTVAPPMRRTNRERLEAVARKLEEEFPWLTRTDDARLRLADVTYDIGEHRTIDPSLVAQAVDAAKAQGLSTTVSSVHFHIAFDRHDKATGCLSVLRERLGVDTTRARMTFAFIGDSGNDASGFAAFRTSIGVSNLRGRPTVMPQYITASPSSAGFCEAARCLLSFRRPLPSPA